MFDFRHTHVRALARDNAAKTGAIRTMITAQAPTMDTFPVTSGRVLVRSVKKHFFSLLEFTPMCR